MKFKKKIKIEIIAEFDAPLLGYNVEESYNDKIDAVVEAALRTYLDNTNNKVSSYNGITVKINRTNESIRISKNGKV